MEGCLKKLVLEAEAMGFWGLGKSGWKPLAVSRRKYWAGSAQLKANGFILTSRRAKKLIPVTLGSGRPDSAGRTSRNERDGSDPPFFAAGAARKGGGMFPSLFPSHHPPFRGRFRPIYPCGKASAKTPYTNPRRAPNAPEKNPMKWRYPILIFGGLACSAWGFI